MPINYDSIAVEHSEAASVEVMTGTLHAIGLAFGVPILRWLIDYGYLMIFGLLFLGITGVPVPDELLLLYSGYLCHQGRLSLVLAMPAAAVGSMCGISLSYLIGRFVGWPAIHRFGRFLHISQGQVDRTEQWFDRWGKWTFLIAYFIPGVRHVVAILAGTTKMPWRHFAPFAYSGAVIWTSTFILLGFFVGPEAPKLAHYLHGYLVLVGLGVAAAVVAFLFLRWFIGRRRRARQERPSPPHPAP